MTVTSQVRICAAKYFFVLDSKFRDKRLRVGLLAKSSVTTQIEMLECIGELRRIQGSPVLDVRLVEVVDPTTAAEDVERACVEAVAYAMLVFWYSDERCFDELLRALGFKWEV